VTPSTLRSPDGLVNVAGEVSHLPDGSTVRLIRAGFGDESDGILACDPSGRSVARATYQRGYGPRAKLVLEVDDAYWHRGLPELVLRKLSEGAARRGISTLVARVRAADLRLLALLREEFAARETRDGAFVEAELETRP
jgi:hypothetical protein